MGKGNLARGVQMLHSPSLSFPVLPLSLSVYATLLLLPYISSAFFIYALFHQYSVLLAKRLVKLSLKIRDEFISRSLTCLTFVLSSQLSNLFMEWLVQSPHAEANRQFRDQFTGKNGRKAGIKCVNGSALTDTKQNHAEHYCCIQWGLWMSEMFIIGETKADNVI